MTIEKPSRADLDAISQRMKLNINTGDMEVYHAAASGLLDSWNIVEQLHAQIEPQVPDRQWEIPSSEENRLGAWYVTTNIQTASDGLLAGRRVAIKDNVAVAGVPMMNGSHTLEGFVPRRDATIVSRILNAGGSVVGKSVCEDLCFSGGSHTSKPRPVVNPWDESRSAGGSSSGSGALVASGEVDLAIGGDQGGSIRIPSAFCGVVGHKPTWGLVPYTGAFPIEQSIDHVGPIGRTVSDVAAMLTVLAGADGVDPRQPNGMKGHDYLQGLSTDSAGLRIGVVTEGFEQSNSDPAVNAVVQSAINALATNGVSAEEVSIPWHLHGARIWDVVSVEGATWQMLEGNAYGMNWKGLYDPELIAYFGQRWRSAPSAFSETVKLVALAGRYALDAAFGQHYAMARNLEPVLRNAYDTELDRFDVLVMPTLPITASELPDPAAPVETIIGRALDMLANTAPFDVTGHPACSVPAGLADGLPVGLMVVGKQFEDATVLRVAHALEVALGGFPTPPRFVERTA
jgi:amidase